MYDVGEKCVQTRRKMGLNKFHARRHAYVQQCIGDRMFAFECVIRLYNSFCTFEQGQFVTRQLLLTKEMKTCSRVV
jgi:hypothetical protein